MEITKRKGGRPPKYKVESEFQEKIDNYFASCWGIIETKKGKGVVEVTQGQIRPLTVSGLALALGLSRKGLCDYEGKPGFGAIVKRAKLTIERSWEERLASGNPTGAIFWLKNHAGYTDAMQTFLGTAETHEQRVARLNIQVDQL